MKDLIVHLLHNDKFTNGYINFMLHYFDDYDHFFALELPALSNLNCKNVHYTKSLHSFQSDILLIDKMYMASKIIASGVFNCVDGLLMLDSNILNKTYLHFWGGDYYCFSNEEMKNYRNPFSAIYRKHQLKVLTEKVGGIINLIPDEYESFCKIMSVVPKCHFVTPMPGDPSKKVNIDSFIRKTKKREKPKIIIGNSATKSNNHLEAFRLIEHIKDKIEVICPLSYGDLKYGKKVIKKGQQIFSENFHPITELMPKEEYNQMLFDCDIALFNMCRQQALGNINTMLQLGKKVYLNPLSPQFSYYLNMGVTVFDINTVSSSSVEKLFFFEDPQGQRNKEIVETVIRNPEEQTKQWRTVFLAQ